MTTNPVDLGWQTQISTEVRPWEIEMAAELDLGDVPVSGTATLTDLLTGLEYPDGLSGTVVVVGTTVTQTVTGLLGGHSYRLVITVAVGGGKKTATSLKLSVPY